MASASTTIILTVMSTRASLRFIDEYANVVYIYRGHDGFPEIVGLILIGFCLLRRVVCFGGSAIIYPEN